MTASGLAYHADLKRLSPEAPDAIVAPLAEAMAATLPAYGIATPRRVRHFLTQAAHESSWRGVAFATLNEKGSATYFEKRYGAGTAVGRRLGNTEPGDGARYHGRGIFQCTGRYNYRLLGRKIGLDLEARPALAADPGVSVRLACEYWKAKGLNALADADDLTGITRKINGGTNGLKDRAAWLKRATAIWPDEAPAPRERPAPDAPAPEPPDMAPLPSEPEAPSEEPAGDDAADAPPIATEPPKPLAKSKTLWGTFVTWISGTSLGGALTRLADNPHAIWLIIAVLVLLVVGGVALAIVFRERSLKRLEHGI